MSLVTIGTVDPNIGVQGFGMVRSGKSGQCRVEFTIEAVQHNAQTAKEGMPVFIDMEFIHITPPGGETRTRPVRKLDRSRDYQELYLKWKETGAAPASGYPLKEWTGVTASQIALCAVHGIKTLEDLCAIPDSGLERLGHNARSLRESAEAFRQAREDNHIPEVLAVENLKLKEDMAAQKRQLDEVMELVKTMSNGQEIKMTTEAPPEPKKPRKAKAKAK